MNYELRPLVRAAVEGSVDEAVVQRLVEHVGLKIEDVDVYVAGGKTKLLQRVNGYNRAAAFGPWFVLLDLGHDAECAPPYRQVVLPDPAPNMCFRIAVRAVEAWLLADRENLAQYLSVPLARVPLNPESLGNPKLTIVQIAQHSRRSDIRDDIIPRPRSGRSVGPAYTSRLIEFVLGNQHAWRIGEALKQSESLQRSLNCIGRLASSLSLRR